MSTSRARPSRPDADATSRTRARRPDADASASRRRGLVVASHRRHYRVQLDDDGEVECMLRGRSLAVACGDRVEVSRSGRDQGVIESIGERSSLFFREDDFRSKLIAANVDQVVGVVAPDPPWNPELLDRWIVAAEANRCRVVLALNKTDLPGAGALARALDPLAALGYAVVPLCARADASPLLPALSGHRSVLVGQSGMGKSTLINRLVAGAGARTGELSKATGSGRHTTTGTALYPLVDAAWLIDSPGMQMFGLAHLSREEVEAGFREMRPLFGHCRFRDCSHTHEPGCAAREAVASGAFAPRRLQSLCRLLAELKQRRAW